MVDVCLLCIMLSVLLFTEERLLTVCSSAVLRTTLKGRLVIRNRPSDGSRDPSVCPTGGGTFL